MQHEAGSVGQEKRNYVVAEGHAIQDQKNFEDQSKKVQHQSTNRKPRDETKGVYDVACMPTLVTMHELVRLLWENLIKKIVT